MLFGLFGRRQRAVDAALLEGLERIVRATERQADAVEAAHLATMSHLRTTDASWDASRRRNEAEILLIEEERQRRRWYDKQERQAEWDAASISANLKQTDEELAT